MEIINSMTCKAKYLLRKITNTRIKSDYDISLGLYCADGSGCPKCQHRFKGSSDRSVIKSAAAVMAMALAVSAFSRLCSAIENK